MTERFEGVPRERQVLQLPASRVEAFREWGTEGTGLTAAARVRDPDGRVALVRNGWSDGWIPPGGAVEPGEEPAVAARREVREETGLSATVGDLLVVVEQTFTAVDDTVASFPARYVVFEASATGEIPAADQLGVEGEEISAAAWFEELPEQIHDGEILREYL
jgi:8-oxo-dGTP pyrophosphatase MutT (NUDIX family)